MIEKPPQVQEEAKKELPEGVNDYDLEMKEDPTAVADYASDIFKYYQEREVRVEGKLSLPFFFLLISLCNMVVD